MKKKVLALAVLGGFVGTTIAENAVKMYVDVLQRMGQHPASLVEQLTPRVWKTLFARNPLRSDLYERDELRSRQ